MSQYLPSRIGTLAQALDEAIPEGVTGMDAAKAVADFLDARGFVIQPKEWRCETCGKTFPTFEAKHRHKVDKHTPHRDLSAKDRPANRGDIPCGACDRSFANEQNARQHRRDAQGGADYEQTTIERKVGHRKRQVAILANALNEHGPQFTDAEMQAIGAAVYMAVGRVLLTKPQ